MSSLIITVIVILAAIILLSTTHVRADIIALMVMLALGLTGVVDQSQVFSGFSSSAVMTILGISMISVALQQTGVANAIGNSIFRLGRQNEILLILMVTLASAGLSLFMNNIAAVGILLPAVMTLSRRSRTQPSRLLIPLAFGTILGGMATLLTTSNIIVSGALKDAGFSSFGLLDYFPVGAPVVVVGTIYLITAGRKLLPKPQPVDEAQIPYALSEKLTSLYSLESNLSYWRVLPVSPMNGKKVTTEDWFGKAGLHILGIYRKNKVLAIYSTETTIQAEDILIAQGIVESEQSKMLNLEPVNSLPEKSLASDENPLSEVILSPHSRWIGKNLREIHFRDRYGLTVLSIWRQGRPILSNFSHLNLEVGDALLVQGSAEHIHQVKQDHDLLLLEENSDAVLRPKKLWLAVIITLLTLGLASTNLLPVAEVVLLGAVILLLTGCMDITDAIQRIEWRAIFIIAGMWPLTIAIRETGLAAMISNYLLGSLGSVSPMLIAAFFLFLSMLFAQFLSGPVAPIVIIPLALNAATTFNMDPHPLALAVALGCSLVFMTPISHPVNIMVMNPGGYTFKDFFKVGFPLTVLAFFTILAGLHFIWGL